MRSPRRHRASLTTLFTRHVGYLCIWAQALASCAVFAEIHQERLPVFRVDTKGLAPHEIGAELGRQWKSRFPELEAKLDALLAHRLDRIAFTDEAADRSLPTPLQDDPGGLTKPHSEELEGLASALHLVSRDRLGDGFLSWKELLLVQRLPDLRAHDSGSAFGVYGSRSKAGIPLLGFNLDGQPEQEPIERGLETITVYLGEDRALVNIGFAGKLGITAGFNQSGLFLAYLPVRDIFNEDVTEAASEPIAYTMRRVLETYDRIDAAAAALSWPIDNSNYSIVMADRDQTRVVEHAAGKRGRLRGPSSKYQPAMAWRYEQQIAAVGCFALSTMPTGCSSVRDRYRWQRFRNLASLNAHGPGFRIEDIVRTMLDRTGSTDAINAPTTYQTLAFSPASADLYLGRRSPAGDDAEQPVMHHYTNLVGESRAQRRRAVSSWIPLWLLITGIAVVTLWIRLRLPSRQTSSVNDR